MSRRKRQEKGLLGANGRPLGEQPKSRPILGADSKPLPPTPVPPATAKGQDMTLISTAGGGTSGFYGQSIMASYMRRMLGGVYGMDYFPAIDRAAGPAGPTLKDRVTRDIEALVADFDGEGGEELPKVPLDLTAYADAYQFAMENCPHNSLTDTMYAKREAQCDDCGKYMKRPKNMFGW